MNLTYKRKHQQAKRSRNKWKAKCEAQEVALMEANEIMMECTAQMLKMSSSMCELMVENEQLKQNIFESADSAIARFKTMSSGFMAGGSQD